MFGCGRGIGIIILAAVVAVVFIVMAIFGLGSVNPYYGGYYGGMMGGFGGLGMLLWIPIVLVIVAIVGYFLWRGYGGWGMGDGGGCCGGGHYGRYPSYQSRDDPLAILRQRYARGEISREQFEQMRKDVDSQ
jgi:putative membrane protein